MVALKNSKIIILGLGVTGRDVLASLKNFKKSIIIVDDDIKEKDKLEIEQNNIKILDTEQFLASGFVPNVIIKSPGIKYKHPVIQAFKDAKIINDIEMAYYLTKNTNIKIIAVTGTNGKSSIVTFITELLKNAGYNAFSCGNIGVSPLNVLRKEKEIDFLVMELSSFQLKSIESFKPHFAFFLNISPDHLDYHVDLEEYLNCKLNIIKNGTMSGYFFVNKDIKFDASKLEITLLKNDFNFDEDICSIAKGINIENLKLVYQMCKILKIDFTCLKDTLINKYKPLEHRMELVANIDGINYYNDSKATNISATSLALKQLNNVILLVGGSDKGEKMEDLIPYLENVKQVIAYGSNREAFNFIDNIIKVNSLKEAMKIARDIAIISDNILLSPAAASFDQFKNFEHRGIVFKELVMSEYK